MSLTRLTVGLVLATLLFSLPADIAAAVITPAQRQKLAQVNRNLQKAGGLIRMKKFDEAAKLLDKSEKSLQDLVSGGIPRNNRFILLMNRQLLLGRQFIARAKGGAAGMRGKKKKDGTGVSFSEDVAPIIEKNCVGCHSGDQPKGGLDLETFAGWEAGGASKIPLARVLLPRLTAVPAKRMPKGKPALSRENIQTIALWLRQGSQYDGESKDTPISELTPGMKKSEPVVINKPSGDETISFTKDVAPFVAKICADCHKGNDPPGGYDLSTFEGLMRGGNSGAVIEPGDPEKSRLWLMVSNKITPRMPPGQRRITRDNYEALTTWIREGAVFDGDDPKKSLLEIVPSDAAMQAAKLAEMSPEEFVAHRRKLSDAHWKRAFPQTKVQPVETAQFLIYGNVPKDRINQIKDWAAAHVTTLRQTFSAKGDPIWKGKLAIYILKDRFAYQEFSLAVDNRRRVPEQIHGHAVVTADGNEAYVVLEDVGDTPSATSPGTRALLVSLMTQAFLQRMGDQIPGWAVQGAGLHLAAKSRPNNPYFPALKQTVPVALRDLTSPEQIFEDGTFSPAETPAVGAAIVNFLISKGGQSRFSQFVKELAKKGDLAAATRAVYRTTPAALAATFVQSLGRR